MALLWGGPVLLVLERISGSDISSDWVVWPEIVTSTKLENEQMGEAGAKLLPPELLGKRSLQGPPQVPFQTRYGLLPVLLSLAQYAKRARRQHSFGIANQSKGSVRAPIKSLLAPMAGLQLDPAASNVNTAQTQRAAFISRTGNSPSAQARDGYTLARSPFAVGRHSELWLAWADAGLDDDEELIFKRAKLAADGRCDDIGRSSLVVELQVYEKAQSLQGHCIPSVVSVVYVEEDSETTPRQACTTLEDADSSQSGSPVGESSFGTASSGDSLAGLILSDVGCSLQLLSWLSGDDGYAIQAHSRLSVNFLSRFAECLVKANCSTLAAATEHIVGLVDAALRDFHGAGVLHGDIAARNICIRHTGSLKLKAALVDFEDSTILADALSSTAEEETRLRFDEERNIAKGETEAALESFWPSLIPELTRLSSTNLAA